MLTVGNQLYGFVFLSNRALRGTGDILQLPYVIRSRTQPHARAFACKQRHYPAGPNKEFKVSLVYTLHSLTCSPAIQTPLTKQTRKLSKNLTPIHVSSYSFHLTQTYIGDLQWQNEIHMELTGLSTTSKMKTFILLTSLTFRHIASSI